MYRIVALGSFVKHTKRDFRGDDIVAIRDVCKREVNEIMHASGRDVTAYSEFLREHVVPLAFDNDLSATNRLRYLLENIITASAGDERHQLDYVLKCGLDALIKEYEGFSVEDKSRQLAVETLEFINHIRKVSKPSFYY